MWQRFIYDLADNITMNFRNFPMNIRESLVIKSTTPDIVNSSRPFFLFFHICILYKFNLLKMTRIYVYVTLS